MKNLNQYLIEGTRLAGKGVAYTLCFVWKNLQVIPTFWDGAFKREDDYANIPPKSYRDAESHPNGEYQN